MPLVDLHVHTSYSHDARGSPEEIVMAAVARGLSAVGICDHDSTGGAISVAKAAEKLDANIIVVKGCEVSTSEGHLLVLDCKKALPPGLTPEETLKRAHRAGAFVVEPHPYDRIRHGIGRIVEGVDAVEVYNSRFFINRANRVAKDEAEKMGLPGISGSDAHVPEMVGICSTEVPPFSGVKELLAHIENNRGGIVTGRTPPSIFARQSAGNAMRWLKRRFKN
jgi:predicted metal-dependent phosphoesterase TrpH